MWGRQNLLSFMVGTHMSYHVRALGPSSWAISLRLSLVRMGDWRQLTGANAISQQVTLMLTILTFSSISLTRRKTLQVLHYTSYKAAVKSHQCIIRFWYEIVGSEAWPHIVYFTKRKNSKKIIILLLIPLIYLINMGHEPCLYSYI